MVVKQAAKYILRNKSSNDQNTRIMKEQLRRVIDVYTNQTRRTQRNGELIGRLITNSVARYYKKQPFREDTNFKKGIRKGIMSTGIVFVEPFLTKKNSNNNNTRKIKNNLTHAYSGYVRSKNSNNFNAGHRVGTKLTNGIVKFYEKEAERKKFKNNTPFVKGFKNGVRKRFVYWLPGVYVRSIGRKFEYNTSKFMKRAHGVRGVENIHRLFSQNNKNEYRRNRQVFN
jgi:hypothetical protein